MAEVIGHEGLVTIVEYRDNGFVTITFLNGTQVRAMLLSRSADTLRVAIEGNGDAAEFTAPDGHGCRKEANP